MTQKKTQNNSMHVQRFLFLCNLGKKSQKHINLKLKILDLLSHCMKETCGHEKNAGFKQLKQHKPGMCLYRETG